MSVKNNKHPDDTDLMKQRAVPDAMLPPILAGPIVRHVCPEQVVIWLVSSVATDITLCCYQAENCLATAQFAPNHDGCVQLGERAYLHVLQLTPASNLPYDAWLTYDIGLGVEGQRQWLCETLPELTYNQQPRPDFMIKSHVDHVLHGSCRKPHHADRDGLLVVDEVLQAARAPGADQKEQPALVMMSGDQIYADDVAGPMLLAIQQVTDLLGLFDERIPGLPHHEHGQELKNSQHNIYGRTELLPNTKANATLREKFFMGARKPIFTSVHADNHLITLAEVLGMYLLVWSPVLWRHVDVGHTRADLSVDEQERYKAECACLEQFVAGLGHVQRALAHVPVYMIFDDHDVTDDWNLTRGWEESAYGQPFSRRIIGNALIGYLLCQGWGNAPHKFSAELLDQIRDVLRGDTQQAHDDLIDRLLQFQNWHYVLPTQPKMVVLDTRTRRWRSEYGNGEPSGLMDWEALTELQQELLDEQAVILVSPAPIFGVKLIEVVQRLFTWFGHALTVDAENWMAHRGAAYVILNIFRHPRTPHNFVILSGDVHYSFAYDVRLRHREETPHIWQITSSGVMSTFPPKLLKLFDSLNRWMFASHSPLNWLTRRRYMHIRPRRPSPHEGRYSHQRMLNGNGIGRVRLNKAGEPVVIESLRAVDGQQISFEQGHDWDWL